MKKLLAFTLVLALSTGCSLTSNEKLSCSSTTSANGLTATTTYDIEYKDDDIKNVKITYKYDQDAQTPGVGTGTDGTTDDDTDVTSDDRQSRTTDDNADTDTDATTRNATDNTTNTDNTDGVIDGTEDPDGIVDGIVGDAIDEVAETILDITGMRDMHTNQVNTYSSIEGFSSNVGINTDDEYKVTYEIDFSKISDNDLATFNLDRSLKTTRANYESQGLTCK